MADRSIVAHSVADDQASDTQSIISVDRWDNVWHADASDGSFTEEIILPSRHVRILQVLTRAEDETDIVQLKLELLDPGKLVDLELLGVWIQNSEDPDIIRICDESLDLLHVAVRRHNLRLVRLLLERKCDVDALDARGLSALHEAILVNDLPIIKLLVEHGAKFNRHEDRISLLQIAINMEREPIALYLLEQGIEFDYDQALETSLQECLDEVAFGLLKRVDKANINTDHLSIVLPLAVLGGNIEIIKLMLNLGANPNTRHETDKSGFETACSKLDLEVIKLLLGAGADVQAVAPGGWTPLHFVAEVTPPRRGTTPWTEIVDLLISRGADVDKLTEKGYPPLFVALDHDNAMLAMSLLSHSASYPKPGPNNDTALHLAVRSKSLQVVQRLLEMSIDVNATDCDNWTPLHYAALSRHPEIIAALVTAGADLSAKVNGDANSPLHLALLERPFRIHPVLAPYTTSVCSVCDPEILDVETVVKQLLDAGADVNAVNEKGITALHLAATCRIGSTQAEACEASRCRVLQMLIDAGASLAAVDQYGRDPIAAAVRMGNEKAAALLLDHVDDIEDSRYTRYLYKACDYDHHDVIRMLLHNGADVNVAEEPSGTALQMACCNRQDQTAEILLKHGADVNMRSGDHETALQAACCSGNGYLVSQLLQRGADPNIAGGTHGSALQAACQRGYITLVEALLDHGALINQRGPNGDYPLQKALHRRHAQVAIMLIERGADVNMVDRFGRTAVDWLMLNSELWDKVRPLINRQHVLMSVRNEALLATVRRKATTILAAGAKFETNDFYALGRCLMFLDRFEDAQIAHEYVVKAITADGKMEHAAYCDMCSVYMIGRRYVCKVCPDGDICEDCMKTYADGSEIEGCEGHTFMEVSGMPWCDEKSQVGLSLMEKTKEWLEAMLKPEFADPVAAVARMISRVAIEEAGGDKETAKDERVVDAASDVKET